MRQAVLFFEIEEMLSVMFDDFEKLGYAKKEDSLIMMCRRHFSEAASVCGDGF
jgi:hypothetical protein